MRIKKSDVIIILDIFIANNVVNKGESSSFSFLKIDFLQLWTGLLKNFSRY